MKRSTFFKRLTTGFLTGFLLVSGHIKIVGPDGQTIIDQGEIDTDALVVGGTVFIGNELNTKESGDNRVLIGNAQDQSVPYVRAQRDEDNYVQMVGRPSTSDSHFFRVQAGGINVMDVNTDGITMAADQSTAPSLRTQLLWKVPGGDELGYLSGYQLSGARRMRLFSEDKIELACQSISFFNLASGNVLQAVSGSTVSDALSSLLTALDSYNLIKDDSTF